MVHIGSVTGDREAVVASEATCFRGVNRLDEKLLLEFAEFVARGEAKRLVNRRLMRLKLKREELEAKAIFTHNLSSHELSMLDSEVNRSRESETLGDCLLRLARKRGVYSFSEKVFSGSDIDKTYWSKITRDLVTNPHKEYLLRIAIALKLSFDEASELLEKAGYTLSDKIPKDAVVIFFLRKKRYDFEDIAEMLNRHNLGTLYVYRRQMNTEGKRE